jgi:hypothetical protein
VVKGGQGLELRVGKQPELQDGGGKVGVDCAGGELDEGAEGECHLVQLVGEGWVAEGELDGVAGGLVGVMG